MVGGKVFQFFEETIFFTLIFFFVKVFDPEPLAGISSSHP
jgi:hypothetical protein